MDAKGEKRLVGFNNNNNNVCAINNDPFDRQNSIEHKLLFGLPFLLFIKMLSYSLAEAICFVLCWLVAKRVFRSENVILPMGRFAVERNNGCSKLNVVGIHFIINEYIMHEI